MSDVISRRCDIPNCSWYLRKKGHHYEKSTTSYILGQPRKTIPATSDETQAMLNQLLIRIK